MGSGSRFQADSLHQLLRIINHALIKAVDLRLPMWRQLSITCHGSKQSCGEGSVDALEKPEEDERDAPPFPSRRISPKGSAAAARRTRHGS